jgi:hypothetical protein
MMYFLTDIGRRKLGSVQSNPGTRIETTERMRQSISNQHIGNTCIGRARTGVRRMGMRVDGEKGELRVRSFTKETEVSYPRWL